MSSALMCILTLTLCHFFDCVLNKSGDPRALDGTIILFQNMGGDLDRVLAQIEMFPAALVSD